MSSSEAPCKFEARGTTEGDTSGEALKKAIARVTDCVKQYEADGGQVPLEFAFEPQEQGKTHRVVWRVFLKR